MPIPTCCWRPFWAACCWELDNELDPGEETTPSHIAEKHHQATHDFLTAVEDVSGVAVHRGCLRRGLPGLYGDTKRKEAITHLRTVSDPPTTAPICAALRRRFATFGFVDLGSGGPALAEHLEFAGMQFQRDVAGKRQQFAVRGANWPSNAALEVQMRFGRMHDHHVGVLPHLSAQEIGGGTATPTASAVCGVEAKFARYQPVSA